MQQSGKSIARGITLIEMIVTVLIVGVMITLLGTAVTRARARARAVQCLSNQKQISIALLSFYEEHGRFPQDGPMSDLGMQLSPYIPWPEDQHSTRLPTVYKCPNDREQEIRNSYQPYYVMRKSVESSEYFLIGCPRHNDTDTAYLNLNGVNYPIRASAETMTVNGDRIITDVPEQQRTIRDGDMSFSDASTAKVKTTTDNYNVTAVASFRQEGGKLYTIVRITGVGATEFKVTSGTRFEVITPVALIGVRGTRFLVITQTGYTRVILCEGSVVINDRLNNRTTVITGSGIVDVGVPNCNEPWIPGMSVTTTTNSVPTTTSATTTTTLPSNDTRCIQCRTHCKNGSHCDRCPLHVRYPNNIGTLSCVQCQKHCIGTKKHCGLFCPWYLWLE